MRRTIVLAMMLCVPLAARAQKSASGTADEAKAMLTKATAAIKADKAKTIATINKGEGGFLDRDLYPFCFNVSDGVLVATTPARADRLGKDVRLNKDADGKEYGKELYKAAQEKEGKLTEVSYLFQKPDKDSKPVPKVSFVTRVGDLGCGVGYYK